MALYKRDVLKRGLSRRRGATTNPLAPEKMRFLELLTRLQPIAEQQVPEALFGQPAQPTPPQGGIYTQPVQPTAAPIASALQRMPMQLGPTALGQTSPQGASATLRGGGNSKQDFMRRAMMNRTKRR